MESNRKNLSSGDVIEDEQTKTVKAVGAAVHILRFACTRYRHRKRGSTYSRIGEARLQASTPVTENTRLTIYVGEDGHLWARPYLEFSDGRFEPLP